MTTPQSPPPRKIAPIAVCTIILGLGAVLLSNIHTPGWAEDQSAAQDALAKQDLNKAEAFLNKALAQSPDDHAQQAETLYTLAKVYHNSGQLEQAIQTYKDCLQTTNQNTIAGQARSTIISNLADLALHRAQTGHHAAAIHTYQFVVLQYEATLGADHPKVLTTLNHLGVSLESVGKPDEAEQQYTRARTLAKSKQHKAIEALSTINLGGLYIETKRLVEAERLLNQGITLAKQEKEPTPEQQAQLATAKTNLAVLYQRQGKYKEAEPLLKESLTLFDNAPYVSAPYKVPVLKNLANLYRKTDRPHEADIIDLQVQAILENS